MENPHNIENQESQKLDQKAELKPLSENDLEKEFSKLKKEATSMGPEVANKVNLAINEAKASLQGIKDNRDRNLDAARKEALDQIKALFQE